MGKKKVDPERKRRAVVDVIKGKPLREAARELGVAPSTLHESVKETRERTAAGWGGEPAAAAPAPEAASPGAPAAADAIAKVDRILAHAGAAPADNGSDVTKPLTPQELAPKPALDKAEYCVQKCSTFKGMAVFGISQNYKVPSTDPLLKQLAPLSMGLELEIRAQADFLFPYLEKWGGPGVLAAMAIYELWQMAGILKEHGVKNYGYVQPDPKKPTKQIDVDKERQAKAAALEAENRRLAAEVAAGQAQEETELEEEPAAPAAADLSAVVKPDPFNCPNQR